MNPELVIAFVGIGGTIIGTALGSAGNILADRRREKSEAIVWRRQHTLTSAAEFLSATSVIQVEGRTIKDFAEEIVAAHQARHETGELHERLATHQASKHAALQRADDALSRLSILLPQEPYLVASLYLGLITTDPHAASAMAVRAHLNDLLREDLALPPRETAAGTEISPEEYLEKVAELRGKPGATD
jgi:hypothetical protein